MPQSSRRHALQLMAAAVAAGSLPPGTSQGTDEPKQEKRPKSIRVGMIGLDTSHVSVFSKLLNRDGGSEPALDGARVVAAYAGGNPDFPLSKSRVEGFTNELRDLGVKIVASIDDLLPLVDAVMLESVDGSQHLAQSRPVFEAKKPLFIDKPLAASLADVIAIAELGRKYDTPWFTASSSRFTPGYPELRNNPAVGEVLGCDTYSQSRGAIGHPDLFWYGVHGVDLLYSLMGVGCEQVTAVQTEYTEQVTGLWDKGRVGTFRAIREHSGKTGLGATLFGSKEIRHVNNYYDYFPLLAAVVEFFRTHKSPVSVAEMVEVFAYMEAAEESKRRGGIPVTLQHVMESARRAG